MTVLAYAEGLLWSRRDRPILGGFQLLSPLGQSHRLIMATAGTAEVLEHRLRTERLKDQVAEMLDISDGIAGLPLWRRQFEVARSRYPLDFVISADPLVVEWVVDHGVPALFFCHPGFAQAPLRAERGKARWDDLVNEVEARG